MANGGGWTWQEWGRASPLQRFHILRKAYPRAATAAGIALAGAAVGLLIEVWDDIVAMGAWTRRNAATIRDLAIAGGIAAAVFGGWRAYADHRRAETERAPFAMDRVRQVTASFEGAVRLLAHKDRSVRLGAIYALERIARENPDEHWPIIETLAASVREWSVKMGRSSGVEAAPIDIQAVFTVLGRRETGHEDPPRRLDLAGAYLVKVRPDPASPQHFARAYLCSADLRGAYLREAGLREANLSQADLSEAHLSRTDLTEADLEGAVLKNAFLYRANLTGADLEGANLTKADLSHAALEGAWIRGVDLSTVEGLTQEQLDAAMGDVATMLPARGVDGSKLTRPERWVSRSADGANVSEATEKVVTLRAGGGAGSALQGISTTRPKV